MEKNLYTRSILTSREEGDGIRVSVMSRHTLEDGVTPDERIISGESFDEWMEELAPPGKLVGAYYRGELLWPEYEAAYLAYLRTEEVAMRLREFAKRCTQETVTLLCVEEDAAYCHRRILAEEIQRLEPALNIHHR